MRLVCFAVLGHQPRGIVTASSMKAFVLLLATAQVYVPLPMCPRTAVRFTPACALAVERIGVRSRVANLARGIWTRCTEEINAAGGEVRVETQES